MLSGTLTRESLISVFRALSYKQRQGILEVTIPSSYYELCFHDGVVVEVKGTEDSVARLITSRLLDGGFITRELTSALSDVELTVDQLFEFLVGDGHVDEHRFLAAKRAVEHDIIICLAEAGEGFFNFTPKLIQFRPELSMGGHPGQLLLDIVEYDNDRERFEEIFEGIDAYSLLICRTGEPSSHLTFAERAVWNQIHVEESIRSIYDGALLGVFDLQQALLSLYERNLIGVAETEENTIAEPDFDEVVVVDEQLKEYGVTDTLRLKLQKEHTEESTPASASEHVLRTPTELRTVGDAEPQANVETLIDKAVTLLRGMDASIAGSNTGLLLKDVEETMPSLFIDEDIGDLSLAEEDVPSALPLAVGSSLKPEARGAVDADSDDEEYEEDDLDEDSSEQNIASDVSFSEKVVGSTRSPASSTGLDRLNYVLLETPVAFNVGVILVLVFLVSLAFIAPSMLDSWFDALGTFSSK